MKWVSKGKKKKYSLKRLIKSFSYAFQGIISAFKSEQNILIHTIMAALAIGLGFYLKISTTELLIVILVIGLVISLEMVNTAIEYVVDMAMPTINPLAKIAKDVSSGAVLFAALTSVAVGIIIYLPKILALIK